MDEQHFFTFFSNKITALAFTCSKVCVIYTYKQQSLQNSTKMHLMEKLRLDLEILLCQNEL